MTKIIQAKDILKAKNYVHTKFDTNGFLAVIGKYFMENDVNAVLCILSERFADISPDSDAEKWFRDYFKRGTITQADIDRGYLPVLESVPFEESNSTSEDSYRKDVEQGYYCPHIIVDKPFVRNAVFALRTLAGYNVESVRKRGETHYEVTLV